MRNKLLNDAWSFDLKTYKFKKLLWRHEGAGHSMTYVEEKREERLWEGLYIFGDTGLRAVDQNAKILEVKKVETQGKAPDSRTGHASCFNKTLRLYCISGGKDNK